MELANRAGAVPAVDADSLATPKAESRARSLSLLSNLKLGLFHIGSSMADILATGVWNRVMIKELGFAATPIALLLALRYFLAPLSVWVGRRSDTRPIWGYHRLPYVWSGRLMMVASYVLLGVATLDLAGGYNPALKPFSLGHMEITVTANAGSLWGWLGVVVALIAFSVGSTFSGTTFLSLIYDRTPKPQRTRAVSVVWFFLILGFAVSGIIYSRLLPSYSREGFLSLFLIAPLIMGGLWFFSLVREEARVQKGSIKRGAESASEAHSFWQEMRTVFASRQTRLFFFFLALTTMAFYAQDVILEPFAAEVFGMPLATTNRFSTYWGSMTLLGIVVSLLASRRFPQRVNNISLSRWGVVTLVITFALFVICALAHVRGLVTLNLILMGVGLGMWTVGSLGLMMDMTKVWGAGLYLALWTVCSTLARGAGIIVGGTVLDTALAVSGGQMAASYSVVFVLQTVAFGISLIFLARINVSEFERETPHPESVFAATMD